MLGELFGMLRGDLADFHPGIVHKSDELFQRCPILNLFAEGGGDGAFGMRRIVVPDTGKGKVACRDGQASGLLDVGRDDFGGTCLDDREESLSFLDGFCAVGRLQADALSMPVDLIAVVIDSSGTFGINRSDIETQTFLSHGWKPFISYDPKLK